jgi:hypothetical protein
MISMRVLCWYAGKIVASSSTCHPESGVANTLLCGEKGKKPRQMLDSLPRVVYTILLYDSSVIDIHQFS